MNIDSKTRKEVTFLVFFFMFLLGLGASGFGPSMPSFVRLTGVSEAKGHYYFLVKPIGFILSSLCASFFLKRIALKICFVLLSAGWSIFFMSSSMASHYFVLVSVLFLLAFAEGGLEVMANLMVVNLHREKFRSFMNLTHFFFGFGSILAPAAIGLSLEKTGSISAAYWMIFGMSLFGIFFIFRIRKMPPIHPEEEPDFGSLQKGSRVAFFWTAVFLFCAVSAETGVGFWIFRFATENRGFSYEYAGYLNSAYWIFFTGFRLVGASYRRIGTPTVLSIHLIGSVLVLIPIFFLENSGILWAGIILSGAGHSILFPCALVLLEQKCGLNHRNMGLLISVAALGAMFSPWLIGEFYTKIAPISMFPVIGASLLIALVAVIFLGCVEDKDAKVLKSSPL